MVVPFGSARERRSRTTYRPTVTPEWSTHVDPFTDTTPSLCPRPPRNLTAPPTPRHRITTAPPPLPVSVDQEICVGSGRIPDANLLINQRKCQGRGRGRAVVGR
ncbi:hypothetical protein C1A38_21255 [Verrucosispora sp. ts21]|nr:hypothetical protein C1A38_21255 [Verrucosispora sp. ts21]